MIEQPNRAITDLINLFSTESSLPIDPQGNLLSNLQRACRPLIRQQQFKRIGFILQSTI